MWKIRLVGVVGVHLCVPLPAPEVRPTLEPNALSLQRQEEFLVADGKTPREYQKAVAWQGFLKKKEEGKKLTE